MNIDNAIDSTADELFEGTSDSSNPIDANHMFFDEPQTSQTGADGGAEEAPNEEDEPAEEEKPAAFQIVDGKLKYGETEYDEEELKGLITKARNADEITKASNKRFQEAAELKKSGEMLLSQNEALVAVGQKLAALPDAARDQFFAMVDQLESGGSLGAAPASNAPVVPAGANVPQIDWNELSEESRAIVAAFAPAMQRLQALEGQFAEVKKVLPEVESHVRGTKEERMLADAAQSIKAEYGRDVAPTEIAAAVKSTGVSDGVAAWLKVNAKSLAAASANEAVKNRQSKAPETPSGEGNTFDSSGMTADEIFAMARRGLIPQKS